MTPRSPHEESASRRYLEPNQARSTEPTAFENALADAIEAAYARGTYDLEGLVEHLTETGPPHPSGVTWSPELFVALAGELGHDE